MDGALGGLLGDSEQEGSKEWSFWKSWIVSLTFCVVWFAVTSIAIILLFVVLAIMGLSESFSMHLSISFSYLIAILLTLLFMNVEGQLSDLSGKLSIDSSRQALILLLGIPVLVTVVDLIVVLGYGIGYELAFGVPELSTDIGVDWGSGPVALGLVVISTILIAPIADE